MFWRMLRMTIGAPEWKKEGIARLYKRRECSRQRAKLQGLRSKSGCPGRNGHAIVLGLSGGPSAGSTEKAFHFKEKTVGVFIGVVVLLVCIGFVVLMMVSEWSEGPTAAPLAENAAAPAKKAARKAAKKPAKRPAAKPKPKPKKKK
jgi:hypothetical protein